MHRDELYSLVNGTTIYPLSKKSLTSFLSYVHEKCPVYRRKVPLKATWLRQENSSMNTSSSPDILVTWRAVMAALGILYPNSPSTDSAARSLLSGGILPKVSPPPYESPTVPEVASAPQQTQLFLLLQQAVTSYGIHSPYVMGLLDSLMDTNIVMLLYDWKSLFSMLLTPAQFVIWSSEYNKLADAEIF
ncbi:hypothetical protein E2320_020100 [Naja naja]|nr:hypothetical protein E2320_020100 [Naja naja]